MLDIVVPTVGESITEGTILGWEVQSGGFVEKDGVLFELETDKITMPVTSEIAGTVTILVEAGQVVQIGDVVARVQPGEAPQASATPVVSAASPKQQETASAEIDGRVASPAGRFALAQHGVAPQDVQGTGKDGRIMKGDVIQHLQKPAAPAPAAPAPKAAPAAPVAKKIQDPTQRQRREKMTPIRKRIAERLIQSQHTAAILTTFNEVDLTQAMAYRKRYQDAFEKRHGIKLGFMSFFVKAVVLALKEIPEVNAFIDGDEVVYNNFFDIGIAVGTPKGLVVPVVRDAEQLSFAGVEQEIGNLAKKARDRKLTLEDLSGGSFTITNGGVYGSLLSTPILNPPQSAILGMHGIKKRPMVVGDKIEIRPMMYLALSYDHRLIDGKEAVTFLKRIVECVEDPERMLLEV